MNKRVEERIAHKAHNFKVGDVVNNLKIIRETPSRINSFLGHSYEYLDCVCTDCDSYSRINLRKLEKGTVVCAKCKEEGPEDYYINLSRIWNSMKYRTNQPKGVGDKIYENVNMCDEWFNDKEKFIGWCIANGYKHGLTIDRIDGTKGYKPDNCRFTTPHVQAVNRKLYCCNRTGYTGVSPTTSPKSGQPRFVGYLTYYGKRLTFGYFNTIKEALEARNNYIIKNKLTEYEVQLYREDEVSLGSMDD